MDAVDVTLKTGEVVTINSFTINPVHFRLFKVGLNYTEDGVTNYVEVLTRKVEAIEAYNELFPETPKKAKEMLFNQLYRELNNYIMWQLDNYKAIEE